MLKEELVKESIPESISRYQKKISVDHPRHYEKTCSLECIEAMEIAFGIDAVIEFCKLNAFKYLWRFKNKNGTEDLEKALWYCNYASGKQKELYHDEEYQDEQVFAMINKAYIHMNLGGQNGSDQGRTDNVE